MSKYKVSGSIKMLEMVTSTIGDFPEKYRDHYILRDERKDTEYLINPTIKYFIDKFSHPKTFAEALKEVEKDVNSKSDQLEETCMSFFNFLCNGKVLVQRDKIFKSKSVQPFFINGACVDHYRIDDLLSERQYTELYLATDLREGTPVVIKLLNSKRTRDKKTYQFEVLELVREFKMLQNASDIKGVCKVYNCNKKTDDYVYLTLEYIPGISLTRFINQEKDLTQKEWMNLIAEILRVFSSLHENNIIHGDIHASNIVVSNDKLIRVIDLGLSKRADINDSKITSIGGVDNYMPPERINTTTVNKHTKEPDFYSDVYQLGILMYLIVYHKLPFTGFIWEELSLNIKESIPEFKNTAFVNYRVTGNLINMIQKCLSKMPTARYKNATEILDDLERIILN